MLAYKASWTWFLWTHPFRCDSSRHKLIITRARPKATHDVFDSIKTHFRCIWWLAIFAILANQSLKIWQLKRQYLWICRQSVVHYDVPKISAGDRFLFAGFQIPLVQEGGRERLISTPRPYVTDPFHLSSAAQPQPSEGRAIVFQFQPYSTYNYVLVRCIYSKSLWITRLWVVIFKPFSHVLPTSQVDLLRR